MKLSKQVGTVVRIRIGFIFSLAVLAFISFVAGNIVGRVQTGEYYSHIYNLETKAAVQSSSPIVDENSIMTRLYEEVTIDEQSSNVHCEINWFANSDSGWVYPAGYCYVSYFSEIVGDLCLKP